MCPLAGIRANPLCTPNSNTTRFTMRNTQVFRGVPTWHPLLLASDDEKLRAYRDPEVRRKLHHEVVEWTADIPGATLAPRWYDYIWVGESVLAKNKSWQGKSLRELAEAQGKGIIDAFLDLVVEENLDTVFLQGHSSVPLFRSERGGSLGLKSRCNAAWPTSPGDASTET